MIRQLIRVGSNLNQQTRLLHLLKHRGALPDAEILLATLREVAGTLRSISRTVGRVEPRSAAKTSIKDVTRKSR